MRRAAEPEGERYYIFQVFSHKPECRDEGITTVFTAHLQGGIIVNKICEQSIKMAV